MVVRVNQYIKSLSINIVLQSCFDFDGKVTILSTITPRLLSLAFSLVKCGAAALTLQTRYHKVPMTSLSPHLPVQTLRA